MKSGILLLLVITNYVYGQFTYTIDKWYKGKEATIVLTFDDWSFDHKELAISMLNKYGIEGTFYVNKNGQYKDFNNAILNGHEIGNHTSSHGHLMQMDSLQQEKEVFLFNKELTKNIDSKVLTFAYPFGEGGMNTAAEIRLQKRLSKEFIGARGVQQIFYDRDPCLAYDFVKDEMDYYRLKISVPSRGIKAFSERVSWVLKGGGMMVFMYHGISGKGYDPLLIKDFEKQLDTLNTYKNKLWLTSLDKALQYHRERKSAILKEVARPDLKKGLWVIELSDTLDNAKFYHPLTVRLMKPPNVNGVLSVKQNKVNLPFEVIDEKIVVDIVPDNGKIFINFK